jgi:hypothetical protein
MGDQLKPGERVRVVSGSLVYVIGRTAEGTVIQVSTPGDGPPLYHVRMDPPLPQDPLVLRADEIEAAGGPGRPGPSRAGRVPSP